MQEKIEAAAAIALAKRPPHLYQFTPAGGQTTPAFFKEHPTDRAKAKDIYKKGVMDRVPYLSFYAYIGQATLFGKNPDKISSPYHLFAHEMIAENFSTSICFTVYGEKPSYTLDDDPHEGTAWKFLSTGKIVLRIVDNKVLILQLMGGGDFRVGSFLIQLAIEFAIRNQYDEISLGSNRGSGEFYFKLGFVPYQAYFRQEEICEALINNQNTTDRLYIDGGHMFLPEPSLNIWKKRILEQPILPRVFRIEFSPNIPDKIYSNSVSHHDLFFSRKPDEEPKYTQVAHNSISTYKPL